MNKLKTAATGFMIASFMIINLTISPKAMASIDYNIKNIQQIIINEADKQNVEPALALAIAQVESNFDPSALSHAGAKGVMQIMPKTAEQEFGVSRYRLYNPQINIRLGVRFIKQLLTKYDQQLDIALSHYNGGSAVKDSLGNLSVIPATKKYVEKVLAHKLKFEQLINRPFFIEQSVKKPITSSISTKLQQLRMHNITRGFNNKVPLAPQVLSTKTAITKITKTAKLTKQQKVLAWESIFN